MICKLRVKNSLNLKEVFSKALRKLSVACVHPRFQANIIFCREKKDGEDRQPKAYSVEVMWGIGAYAICSASLLVINKVAVSAIPSASFVLISQFVASVVAVLGLSSTGTLKNVWLSSKIHIH
jgi:hypothetical protein